MDLCWLLRMAIPRMPIRTCTCATLFFCMSLTFSGTADAATHWVSPTGAAAWASCVGSTALSGTAACSLATANASASAGDMVYLRSGTYNLGGGIGIQPSNSGTSPSNMITFAAYTGETPTLTNGSDPFWIEQAYISIKGMTFTGQWTTWGRIWNGGNHNEIAYCTFTTSGGGGMNLEIDGGKSKNWVTHNWIHNNSFTVTGQANGDGGLGCTDGGGDVMDVGAAYGTWSGNTVDNNNYNTVENNVFSHAPHAAFENYALYTVFRNNIIHNEPWSTASAACLASATNPASNGKYGHRNVEFDDDYNRKADYVLIEGNRFGFAGVNQANDGADNVTLGTIQAVFRYNYLFGAQNPNLIFKWGCGTAAGGSNSAGSDGGCYNRVFHNTFYRGGYNYAWGLTCGLSTCPWDETNIALYAGSHNNGNIVKNNLMYLSAGYTTLGSDILDKGGPSNAWSIMAAGSGNNWCSGTQTGGDLVGGGVHGCTGSGDPKFSNPDLTNPSSTTLPDLSLQSGSGAIDGGTWLTAATNAGTNSTTLTVADALYFQDGTWGSDLARASAGLGGTFQADWIAIGTVANVVQIRSISYGTYDNPAGTITLASPMTWTTGAPIWLYRKSDGAVVLAGSAPDYGASEYLATQTSGPPAPPTSAQSAVK